MLLYMYLTTTFYSAECEGSKLEYVDNCLIHPLIPMTDTWVNMNLPCDSVDAP